jgi:tRNA/tmRNA/rRNA uracil-C5-methylase (TrmA/RlmC/RlmD family)
VSEADLAVGDEVTVEVGPIAHGGHCVARHDGRVLFVRHALPGETVVARVTEGGEGDRFLRADAVTVVVASPDRVDPVCRFAHPGGCGGCDFQHVSLDRQRLLKAEVVREQFARLARLDLDALGLMPTVEPVPGDLDGLGWRTRVEFALSPARRLGLRQHRSHDVVEVDRCVIAADGVNNLVATQADWLPSDPDDLGLAAVEAVDIVAPGRGAPVAVEVGPRGSTGDVPVPLVREVVHAGGAFHDFGVSARGFWQVHPGAASTFADAVLQALQPEVGERALDLYAGVGLFAVALADAVGPTGQVIAVESDALAVDTARFNVGDRRNVLVAQARVDDAFGLTRRVPRGSRRRPSSRKPTRLPWLPERADLVVLDPPRTGAGRDVCGAVAALRPRAAAYVACDPAALARDTAYLAEHGYLLRGLRAFDAFPMTHHLECVALFTTVGPSADDSDILTSR